MPSRRLQLALALSALLASLLPALAPAQEQAPPNFATENLVAWCIVPFDAAGRGPAERAAMLRELGLRRCAYDWREQHIPEFEDEILQYAEHEVEFFAFWKGHLEADALFEKHDIAPQIWITLRAPDVEDPEQLVESAARNLEDAAGRCAEAGAKLGLYNHGGWGGEPSNLAAVCERLHQLGHANVGIVYNWHHAHDHIEDWPESLALIQPYLLCLNLNGMNAGAQPKILPLGEGEHDLAMLGTLLRSGYDGPIGILDHRHDVDSKVALEQNLAGLKKLLPEAVGAAGE